MKFMFCDSVNMSNFTESKHVYIGNFFGRRRKITRLPSEFAKFGIFSLKETLQTFGNNVHNKVVTTCGFLLIRQILYMKMFLMFVFICDQKWSITTPDDPIKDKINQNIQFIIC